MGKHMKGMLLSALLAGGGVALAQEPSDPSLPPQPSQPSAPPVNEHMRTGMEKATGEDLSHLRTAELKVDKVDRKKHSVTFEAKVSPEASFTKDGGQPIKLDQLQKGDTIRAAFDPATGEVVAVEVIQVKK